MAVDALPVDECEMRSMRTRRRHFALASIAMGALILSGCSAVDGQDDLLAEHDLDGLSGRQIVEQLDTSEEPRPLALGASVRENEVVLSDGSTEIAVDLPEDQQYVSIAPYVEQTHECYYHSLATCQGELTEAEVEVTITAEDGEVLVDEAVTTYANGFVGFWVPRDISGTIEVAYGDLTGSVPFTTTEGSATCITTLQVS